MEYHQLNEIKKIYLTASGGPFLNYKINQFKRIKPKDAIKHPKWKMGKKISVDSSTLMNKILELVTSINNQMWLGHFDVWADEGIVLYRNTSLFNRNRVSQEQLDNVMVRAVLACDQFFPAFQYILWAGKNSKEALEAVLFNTEGEA